MQKTILHVDGDSFFASCEISLNPSLRGKPVVTGMERGIATSMNTEAKALGIFRGMPVFQIKKLYPQAIVVNSNYKNYKIFAHRMYEIVRRYTASVEEYSVDECFADITNLSTDPINTGKEIQQALEKELGVTFSIGIAPTKVLAKIASKHQKPNGLTIINFINIESFLHDLPIGKVWGIGPQTTLKIQRLGIRTALDFINKSGEWVKDNLSLPQLETWHELRGTSVYKLHSTKNEDEQQSIQSTRTFPKTTNRNTIFGELSKNVEEVCTRARTAGVASKKIHYFLKTAEFKYHRQEIPLTNALSNPSLVLEEIKKTFEHIYEPNLFYRASGVTLSVLVDPDHVSNDLFGSFKRINRWDDVFKAFDKVKKRYGKGMLMLGSSMMSTGGQNDVFDQKEQKTKSVEITNFKNRSRIPFMGEVN
ncbi:MAG: DNA polymerase IV [Parcubacteria bacterium C7867-005]|nr:MAG: DNA polymerase IV [Parcubacteria bacterium C7867-005]